MKNSRTNLLKKLCAVTLAAAMLAGAGLTEAGTYIGTAVQVDAVTSAPVLPVACEFDFEANEDGGITIKKYTGEKTDIVIPSKIYGKAVTKIGDAIFQGNTYITSVTISDSVKSIGSSAFNLCTSLKKVTIGNGVTSIENGAFSNCISLKTVASGDGVTSIGQRAFEGCTNLTNVAFGNSVTYIGSYAFSCCTSLKTIPIPNSVKSIGMYAFYGTSWYYNQPDGVVYAGKIAYKYKGEMPKNTKITLKDGTVGITDSAFDGCTSLTEIKIPNSVTSIGSYAFDGCTSLTEIKIPNSVTSIDYAFYGCTNLENVTISKGVTSIGYYAFNDCTSLKEINVDKNNKNYSSANGVLFNKDKTTLIKYPSGKADTEYSIPNSVTSIGSHAFWGCKNLKEVTIGSSVTSIDSDAFYNCTSLKEINVDKNNKNYSSANGVLFNKDKTTLIKYPKGKTDTEYSIPDSVTSIGMNVFRGCTSLEKVTIGNGVTSIGGTFYDCKNLKEVTIGSSVTSINSDAFNDCTSLKEINVDKNNKNYSSANGVLFNKDKTTLIKYPKGKTDTEYSIPDSVTSIGQIAFYGCTSLEKVTIGNGVTSIEWGTFYDCKNLKEVTIGSSVTSVVDRVFSDCTSLKKINVDENNKNYSSENGVLFNKDKTTLIKYPSGKADTEYSIPNSVTSIGEDAFRGCTSLTNVTIGNGVTSIGDWAFNDFTSLTKLTIPNSVTSIGDYAFDGCTSLKEINVDENNKNYSSVNGVLFNKDKTTLIQYPSGKADTEYSIPNSVTSIGDYAFRDCTSLTEVTIGNGVTSIGEWAFYGCTNLENVTISKGVTSIGDYAFNDCTSLKEINVDKNNKNYSSANGVLFNKDKTTLIKYPEGKADTEYSIPDSVTIIGYYAFRDCTSLKEITIGNGVTSIKSNTFDGCKGLEKVTIGNGVTSIKDYAFRDCTSLTEVTIGNGVTSIRRCAFLGCTSLTSVIIPNSVTSIQFRAFGYIYYDFSRKYEKISNFTIYGTKGSEAENYAITNDFMFIDVSELSEQKKSDGNTNVSVYGNIPKTAKLNVKSVSTDVKNAVLAYDITLTKDNKEIEPVGEVTVSIPCDTPDLKVVWLHDGEQTNMNAAYADGKYTFKVSHFSTYVLVKDGLLGDTNGDGKVNIADALMIARYDAKLTTLNDAQISVSDVNGDSKVNIADALKIARYDAKLIDSLD